MIRHMYVVEVARMQEMLGGIDEAIDRVVYNSEMKSVVKTLIAQAKFDVLKNSFQTTREVKNVFQRLERRGANRTGSRVEGDRHGEKGN